MGYLLREFADLPEDESLELTEVWVRIDADGTASLVFSREEPYSTRYVSGGSLKRFGLTQRALKSPHMTKGRYHPPPNITKILLEHTKEINALFKKGG